MKKRVDEQRTTMELDEREFIPDPHDADDSTLQQPPSAHPLFSVPFDPPGPPPPVPSQPSRPDPYIGTTIDKRYLVEQILGEGGMGVVYGARHRVIDKKVAIKIMRLEMAEDHEMVERFLNEAKAASSIGNPHIVDISDFGTVPDGSTYFVMEYLEGKSLGDCIARGPLAASHVVRIGRQIANGLHAAHLAGIIHRDLKPDNVMLITRGDQRDFVKVLDFGIAKVGMSGGRITRTGSVFGTPHYMSPEQAAGVSVDPRTDVYSLGVILYEMCAGRIPFDAENFMGILTQHLYKAPPPLHEMMGDAVPEPLESIIMKCMAKQPELRYSTMAELSLDLERIEQGLPASAQLVVDSGNFRAPADYFRVAQRTAMPTVTEVREISSSRWGFYGLGAGVAVLIAGVLGVIAWRNLHKDPDALVDPVVASEPTTVATSAPVVVEEKIQLGIVVEPKSATVTMTNDGSSVPLVKGLGTLTLDKEGSVAITILADGHDTATRVVTKKDGPTLPISLARKAGGSRVVPPVATPAATAVRTATAPGTSSARSTQCRPDQVKVGDQCRCPPGSLDTPRGCSKGFN